MENWIDALDNDKKIRALELIEEFRELGCPSPESWTRSEICENIPQLARYRFLRPLKRILTEYKNESERWVEHEIEHSSEIGGILKKILDSGISSEEIGKLAQHIAGDAMYQTLYRLDDPYDFDLKDGGNSYPGWSSLDERDQNGKDTGRQILGLFEDLYVD